MLTTAPPHPRSKLYFRRIFLVAVGQLQKEKIRGQKHKQSFIYFFKVFIYLFGCVRSQLWHSGSSIFVVACGIFSQGVQDLIFCVGSLEAQPLDHQGNPKQAFRGSVQVMIVAADTKRIRWILDSQRKRENVCRCVHVGILEERSKFNICLEKLGGWRVIH